MNTYSPLNNAPGERKKVWNADGATDATVAATTAAPAPAATTGCSDCTKKKMACIAAGIVVGVIATLLVKKMM